MYGNPPETYRLYIFITWLGQQGVPYKHADLEEILAIVPRVGIIYIYIYKYVYICASDRIHIPKLIKVNFNTNVQNALSAETRTSDQDSPRTPEQNLDLSS